MSLAGSSQTQLRFIPESTWGVTPTTGNAIELRMTGESLTHNLTKDSSKEISASRQIRSLAVTDVSASGAINIELSYKEYDPFIAAAMMSDWVHLGTQGVTAELTGTFDTTDPTHDTLTLSAATSGADLTTVLKAGYYVRIEGSGVDAGLLGINEGYHQLQVDATTTVLKVAKGSFTNMVGKKLKLRSSWVKIGKVHKSFTIEKHFTDVNQFWAFSGCKVSKMDLSFTSGGFITGSFDMVGRRGKRDNVTALPGTPVASQPYRIMSSVSGVLDMRIDGEKIATAYNSYARELTLSLDNQMEGLPALGELGSVEIMAKEAMITGGLTVYLADGTLYDDFVDSVTKQFSWVAADEDGHGYAFVLDRIDFSEMPVTAGGQGQSVMLEGKFTATMGATSNNSLTIFRL